MGRRTFQEGDLVRLSRAGEWSLVIGKSKSGKKVREVIHGWNPPGDSYSAQYKNVEGKMGLIVYVSRNRLEQPIGYRVLIEGNEVFCKAKVADKYFQLVENQDDEGRGSSKV